MPTLWEILKDKDKKKLEELKQQIKNDKCKAA